MQKSDYIHMIIDNIMVYRIQLPSDLEGNKMSEHLDKYEIKILKIIAGFNQIFLEHFLIISKGQSQNELNEILKKMDIISYMIGPTGNLNYFADKQIEYILTKIGTLKAGNITENKISEIADEQLEKEFGSGQFNTAQALENQLSTASFYLINMGYTKQDIEERLIEVRRDPSKLDVLFTLPQKEIFGVPPELQHGSPTESGPQETSIDRSQGTQDAIVRYIESTHREITPERIQKVEEIMQEIIEHVREKMTEQYNKVFRQIHPDRLNRALKMLKQTKRKSKRLILLLDWFFSSHLLENIEIKVEHWQVSSTTSTGAGVYTAGVSFSRYDPIVKGFNDSKLAKVINIARRILRSPSKKGIQKLGQDLTSETGFDEHLYFTD